MGLVNLAQKSHTEGKRSIDTLLVTNLIRNCRTKGVKELQNTGGKSLELQTREIVKESHYYERRKSKMHNIKKCDNLT